MQIDRPRLVRRPLDDPAVQPGIHRHIAVAQESGARLQVEVADDGSRGPAPSQHVRLSADRHVRREQQVGLVARDAHHVEPGLGHLHVRDDSAVLLRQPGEVERADLPALQMRGHRHDRAGGDDAAAADAGEQAAPHRRMRHAGSRQPGGELGLPLACHCVVGIRQRRAGPAWVTKLGQKPFRQDRSALQLVGLIRRLRPCSVSTGSMAMQLDCTVQSPQFSQTSWLIITGGSACAILPRLRRRRFSVAQTWS